MRLEKKKEKKTTMSEQKIKDEEEYLRLLEEENEYKQFNQLDFYEPYEPQRKFHNGGRNKRERAFMASNRSGKTWAAAHEVAFHLTGKYPKWWRGRRFKEPTRWWVAGDSGESTRDAPQKLLFGDYPYGTGTIPKSNIISTSAAKGVTGLIDFAMIRHVSGGKSRIAFKTYAKGRQGWQAETLHGVWYDEEPPADVYSEGFTRTHTKMGLSLLTFTPLLGVSDVVMRFIQAHDKDTRHLATMTIDQAEHFTPEQREKIVAGYPEHERAARARGQPMLGSGRVFQFDESMIKCEPFDIPADWKRICGIDFGWDHPTAAVWIAVDPKDNSLVVYDSYKEQGLTPVIHAVSIKEKGDFIPIAWPRDGLQTEKGTGKQLKDFYVEQGCNMVFQPAKYSDERSNHVEPGLIDMTQRFESGKFKIFSDQHEWFDEFRLYHRKNGKVERKFDDLISATRYAVMMIDYASRDTGRWNKYQIGRKLKYPNLGIV